MLTSLWLAWFGIVFEGIIGRNGLGGRLWVTGASLRAIQWPHKLKLLKVLSLIFQVSYRKMMRRVKKKNILWYRRLEIKSLICGQRLTMTFDVKAFVNNQSWKYANTIIVLFLNCMYLVLTYSIYNMFLWHYLVR